MIHSPHFPLKTLVVLSWGVVVLAAPDARAQLTAQDIEEQKVISTTRLDGRYLSTRGWVHQWMREHTPKLAFDATKTAPEQDRWRKEVENKLRELMKFPEDADPPAPVRIARGERDGYVVEKWEIYPQPGSVVPLRVLIPATASKDSPVPAVLCYPGSNHSKEELAGEPELQPAFHTERHNDKNHMAQYYVRNGIAAIVIDNPGVAEVSDLESFGTRPSYDRNTFTRYLIDMGWHYLGLSAFNGQHALDWIRSLDFIDPERIALSGHSLGTEPVMVLGVLNPDVKAIVFNDFLTDVRARAISQTKPDSRGRRPGANALTHCVPGLWEWFDYSDLLASLAPRSLLIAEGGATRDLHRVRQAYEIGGAEERFTFHYYAKYRDPEDRLSEGDIPEGLDMEEFFVHANVDAPNHYFKADIAVPWLVQALGEP